MPRSRGGAEGADIAQAVNAKRRRKVIGRKKTFTGCWSCRQRRVKCDERAPTCTPCEKRQILCAGYQQNLVWVEPDQKSYSSHLRRFQEPESTWLGCPTHDSQSVDELILKCDIDLEDDTVLVSQPPFSVFRHARRRSRQNPVAQVAQRIGNHIQTLEDESVAEPDTGQSDPPLIPGQFALDTQYEEIVSSFPTEEEDSLWSHEILVSPRYGPPLHQEQLFLLDQYVNNVVPVLTPVHDTTNPWLVYPSKALHCIVNGRSHLLSAILAHTAFFLANTSVDRQAMSDLGARYYAKALAELRADIEDKTTDLVTLLTTMLTFVIIELFQGKSKTWRCHHYAAWKLLRQQRSRKLWDYSPEAWHVIQSLCLLRIKSETVLPWITEPDSSADDFQTDDLSQLLSSNTLFGHTMGASNLVMACISEINKAYQQQRLYKLVTDSSRIKRTLLTALLEVRQPQFAALDASLWSQDEDTKRLVAKQLHMRAETAAAVIHYYQCLDSYVPRDLAEYVSEVLACISTFNKLSNGNCTMWPVFIAGTELYKTADKNKCRSLFEHSRAAGMMNRATAWDVLEKVWDLRLARAMETGQDLSTISIPWRDVMSLESDIVVV